jgi:glucose-1-phosphate thymidylyltransferase
MIVGVIPAAGHAERLQPLNGSKEMIEIGGRPVIDRIVERMRAGGAAELRVVTRPEKEDVIAYAGRVGASVVLGRPATINESFAAGMAGLAPEDVILLGFPDTIWEPLDGYRLLVEAVEQGEDVVLGMFEAAEVAGADFVRLDEAGRIEGIDIKPERPASDLIWAAAAARRRALEGLERVEWPSSHMQARLRERGPLRGIRLSRSYVDIGTREALRRALTSSS